MADVNENKNASTYEKRSEVFKSPRELTRYWINALELAEDTDYCKQAEESTDIYNGKKKVPFDILYANTEITRSAVYNSVPTPDIRVRHGDKNELARRGATVIERAILYGMDEYDFDDVLMHTAFDLSLVSRGQARVKYIPVTRTVQAEDEQGNPVSAEEVVWQMAVCEFIPWAKFRHGPGAVWSEVPWVAFETAMSRDELASIPEMDEAVLNRIPLDLQEKGMDEKTVATSEKSVFKKARVWQVWDKETRTVYLICPGFADQPVATIDDPLGLMDFFPCPKPVYFLQKQGGLTPIPPYEKYRRQADELNRITTRMHKLVSMLKVRGVRASEVPEIEQVFSADDGQFVASEGALAAMGGTKGLDDAIWMMPIREIIAVVRSLAEQREQVKNEIYEIAGISDIMRGSTDPRETLGAQNKKIGFGSMRLARSQTDFQRFVADIFKLKAEIIANRFNAETLTLIAGEEVPPEVIEFLRSDVLRTYTIDIETDSTIRGDLTRFQANMTAFLDGTAKYAAQIVPAVQAGIVPRDLALTVFSVFARQFKLGKELEDKIAEYMQLAEQQAQQPPDPNQQAEQQQQKQLQQVAAVEGVKSTVLENQKKAAEVEGQNIENVVQLATGGTTQQGFVQ